jgi:hypothetical protein
MTVTGWLSCCWRSTGFGWFAPGVLGGPEHRQRREHRRASESREIVSFVSFVSSVSRIMFLHVSDLWFWWLVNVHFHWSHWRRCICKNYTCNLTAVFFLDIDLFTRGFCVEHHGTAVRTTNWTLGPDPRCARLWLAAKLHRALGAQWTFQVTAAKDW